MKALMTLFGSSVRKFHDNEEGMETMQVVMILALAAIVGVAVYQFGDYIVKEAWKRIKEIFGSGNYDNGSK